jgi:hypothetical protein
MRTVYRTAACLLERFANQSAVPNHTTLEKIMSAKAKTVVRESEIIPADEALKLMDAIMSTPYATVIEEDLTWLARDVFSTPFGG